MQMGGVRYKKGDGTLYVMNERIAWMVENRDKVAVSHKYQDIKMQKISPEGKQKVQLQVVLHDGNSTTFHFVNKNGASAQIADRDKVKELLQDLLPKFKRKVDKELEEKNRILSEHPHLLQLYKDLVITQVLTSEEFWSSHAKQYTQQLAQKQEIGVSGAFLADIKPQTDGCNGLKYNLTNDIIECIFKAYPAVKRKHSEHVPAKLSESEFWTKFFQSHYFHRDRINTGTKDIFTECGKIDDQALKIAVANGAGDVFLDLQTFEDNTLEEGFGGAVSEKSGVNSGNIVHQSMIKRFNQHSTMVLNTCSQSSIPSTVTNGIAKTDANKNNVDQGSVVTNGTKEKHKRNHASIADDTNDNSVSKVADPKIKKARILEKIRYDDLEDDEQMSKGPSQLNLVKIERYLHGPVPVTHHESAEDAHQLESVQYQLLNEINGWNTRTPHKVLVSATAAVNALGELSPGGALMRGFQEQSLAQLVPPEVEKEIRNLYLSLSELLKHFWNSFPPTTPECESKAVRMHEALQRFQMAKLKPFEERALRELSPLGSSLTQHLNQLLQMANMKYATWHDRKVRQHR